MDSLQDDDTEQNARSSDSNPVSRAELAAKVETLQAENDRLREAISAAYRSRYRRSSIGIGLIGGIALLAAAAFPDSRTVLIALGGTGVFAGVLIFYLTPEQFVAASVGERIYSTLAANQAAIIDDLELQGDSIILPGRGTAAPARLFVPTDKNVTPPHETDHGAPFTVNDPRGLYVEPTGTPLYQTLADSLNEFPSTPIALGNIVADALKEQFELVEATDISTDESRLTMAVQGSAYGAVTRFDHPVASLLATTLAIELEVPITVTTSEADTNYQWLVTCRWPESVSSSRRLQDRRTNTETDVDNPTTTVS